MTLSFLLHLLRPINIRPRSSLSASTSSAFSGSRYCASTFLADFPDEFALTRAKAPNGPYFLMISISPRRPSLRICEGLPVEAVSKDGGTTKEAEDLI